MAWQSPHVTPPLGLAEISEFIQRFDGNFGGRLSGFHNYPRIVSLAHFAVLVTKAGITKKPHTGVVWGSMEEPELPFLGSEKITVLNLETGHDLDKPWLDQP